MVSGKKEKSWSFCQFRKEKNGFFDLNYNYLATDFLLTAKSESLRCPRAAWAMQFAIKTRPITFEEHKLDSTRICIKIEFDSFIFFAPFLFDGVTRNRFDNYAIEMSDDASSSTRTIGRNSFLILGEKLMQTCANFCLLHFGCATGKSEKRGGTLTTKLRAWTSSNQQRVAE